VRQQALLAALVLRPDSIRFGELAPEAEAASAEAPSKSGSTTGRSAATAGSRRSARNELPTNVVELVGGDAELALLAERGVFAFRAEIHNRLGDTYFAGGVRRR